MKFTLLKDIRQDPLMRPLLLGLLVFIILFFVSDIYLKHEQIGVTTAAAIMTFSGDEATFTDPISLSALLEILHGDIFFMMMSLMMLCAVYARLGNGSRRVGYLIHLTMSAALLSLVAMIAAQQFQGVLIALWVGLFWTWHTAALWMAAVSLLKLVRL